MTLAVQAHAVQVDIYGVASLFLNSFRVAARSEGALMAAMNQVIPDEKSRSLMSLTIGTSQIRASAYPIISFRPSMSLLRVSGGST